MSVSAAGFFVTAVLVVAATGFAAYAPSPREAAIGGAASYVATALFLAVCGAVGVAVAMLVIAAVIALAVALAIPSAARTGLAATVTPLRPRTWALGAAVAASLSAVLIITAVAYQHSWPAAGGGAGSLLTILHWREPLAVALVVALLALAVVAIVAVGRESDEERDFERRQSERRQRQERAERRRTDREAARRKKGVGSA